MDKGGGEAGGWRVRGGFWFGVGGLQHTYWVLCSCGHFSCFLLTVLDFPCPPWFFLSFAIFVFCLSVLEYDLHSAMGVQLEMLVLRLSGCGNPSDE